MSTLSIAKSRNRKSAAPKKGSVKSNATARRKVTSAAAAAKTPLKADEPKVGRVTKQECVLTLLSQSEGLAAAQRARVPGGHGEKEARFLADIIQAQRRRSPLSHRDAARSLTWKNGRSMSERRSCGSRS
jgi:hypothetical protein